VSELPMGWVEATLDDIATWGSGGTPKSTFSKYYGGGVPWVVTGDLTDGIVRETANSLSEEGLANSSAKLVPPGTVLVAMYGASIGRVGIAGTALASNQAVANAQVYEGVTAPKYVMYYLLSQRTELARAGKGAAQPNIGQGILKTWPIPIAPLAEQARIVAAIEEQFSRLDAGVAALERVRQNLKRMRAAVTGRLVPPTLTDDPVEQLLSHIASERQDYLRRHPYSGSKRAPITPNLEEIPGVPPGWAWATVDQLCTRVVDGVHKKPEYVSEGIPFVTVRNLTAGNGISFERLNHVTPKDHSEFIRRAHPEKGDLLLSKDGTLGVVRAVRDPREFSIFVSVALMKLVSHELTDYLEIALASPVVQRQMVPKGSGLQHIHLEDLRQDCIPIPPLQEQYRIVAEVHRQFSILDQLEHTAINLSKRASALRSSILAAAFSGKLVSQDPSDEPASVLLELIAAEQEPTKRRKA